MKMLTALVVLSLALNVAFARHVAHPIRAHDMVIPKMEPESSVIISLRDENGAITNAFHIPLNGAKHATMSNDVSAILFPSAKSPKMLLSHTEVEKTKDGAKINIVLHLKNAKQEPIVLVPPPRHHRKIHPKHTTIAPEEISSVAPEEPIPEAPEDTTSVEPEVIDSTTPFPEEPSEPTTSSDPTTTTEEITESSPETPEEPSFTTTEEPAEPSFTTTEEPAEPSTTTTEDPADLTTMTPPESSPETTTEGISSTEGDAVSITPKPAKSTSLKEKLHMMMYVLNEVFHILTGKAN